MAQDGWLTVGLVLALSAGGCIAGDSEGLLVCEGDDEVRGATIAAASEPWTLCAGCEPGCQAATDTLRSSDVAARGGDGLTFDPAVAGATSPRRRLPCDTPPCADVWSYVDGARYTRVYDAYGDGVTGRCDPFYDWVVWSALTWSATVPEGTSITFELRAAQYARALADATPVVVEVAEDTRQPIELSGVLLAAGAPAGAALLEVTAVLHPSADGTLAPVLRATRVEMTCQPPD